VGQAIEIALHVALEPGWHLFWKTPGDSGEATQINWNQPAGWKEVDLRFPTPHAIDAGGIINYGYENRVTLIASLKAPEGYKGETVNLSGEATYLICKEACVPGSRTFSLTLPGAAMEPERWRDAFRELPVTYTRGVQSRYFGDKLVITIPEKSLNKAYFFASNGNLVSHSDKQTLTKTDAGYELSVPLSEFSTQKPTKVSGVLSLTTNIAPTRGYSVELSPNQKSLPGGKQ
jgi:thiol:disulfide interchange protein DsbD